MSHARRIAVRCALQALVPLAIGCGGGRDAGGAQPRPAAPVASATARQAPPSGAPTRWTGRLAPGRAIDVRAVSGGIHATAASGDVAEIEARVRGGDGKTTVRFTEDEHGVAARVEPREHGCHCNDGDDDGDGHGERDATVDFELRVPPGVQLVARSVHGGIDVDGVSGPLVVRTVDGGISLRAATAAHARTVNGPITATFRAADLESDSELDTVNGPVQVSLPPGANADLRASTLNGRVHVAFPIEGSFEGHRVHGTIGHGGRELLLRTVNGSIEVARGA
jgi:hypothetical protein